MSAAFWTVPLRIAAAVAVCGYARAAYRVRGWGRLPCDRGATLVLANAQSEIDDTVMVPILTLDGPWRHAVYTVSSRRVFEPGFMSRRVPALAPLLGNANFSRLFRALGMNPVENEPFARRASLRGLSSEERRAALSAWRREHAADVRRLVEILERGGTLYLVPSGRVQRGGKAEAFRSLIDALAPLAAIYVCAMAYDPLRTGKPAMLYRIVACDDGGNLENCLKAARPVTVSQLVSHAIVAGAGCSPESIHAAVSAAIPALPESVFVDPELAAQRHRVVEDALRALYGIGARNGKDGAVRRILFDQHAFLMETLEAARTALAGPARR